VGSKAARCVTCEDCYFHRQALCALVLSEPCPTFRPVVKGKMVPPRQAPLVPTQRMAAASA
jgi:hypothetical protein